MPINKKVCRSLSIIFTDLFTFRWLISRSLHVISGDFADQQLRKMDFADSCNSVSTVTLEKTCFPAKANHGCCSKSSSREGDGKRTAVIKCELVNYDALPDYLKDNEFILDYYRSEWPLKHTVLSLFSIHNETLSVWTHLVGFFIFLALTVWAATAASSMQLFPDMLTGSGRVDMMQQLVAGSIRIMPNVTGFGRVVGEPVVSSFPSTDQSISRWPFFAFMCGAMVCLLTSSACHLLSCHSEHFSYCMLRLDYTGICTLIVTSFFPPVYYSFNCDPFIRNLYIGFITIFGVATVLVSLVPVFQIPAFRTVRAGLFFCMGVSGLIPIMHKLLVFGHRPEALITTGYELVMGAFYGLGVVVYATRVPERWMPGVFDLVGNSHQLFHVLVIAGAYTHYLGGLVYLQWREMERC